MSALENHYTDNPKASYFRRRYLSDVYGESPSWAKKYTDEELNNDFIDSAVNDYGDGRGEGYANYLSDFTETRNPELHARIKQLIDESTINDEDLNSEEAKQESRKGRFKSIGWGAGIGALPGAFYGSMFGGLKGAGIGAAITGAAGGALSYAGNKASGRTRGAQAHMIARGGTEYIGPEVERMAIGEHFNKKGMYTEMLDTFEKIAAESTPEELEIIAEQILNTLNKLSPEDMLLLQNPQSKEDKPPLTNTEAGTELFVGNTGR